jgi:CheY-like chemotaxis protein
VIVDDDVWVRRGRAAALADAGIEVQEMSHQDALAHDGWGAYDIALLDAYDEDAGFDRFTGVRVAERIRAAAGGERVRVVVVTGHTLNDVLRLRFADAGGDELYSHAELRSPEALVAVVRTPLAERVVRPSAEDLAAHGFGAHARPNQALRWVEDHGMEQAFAPGVPQKSLPVTRRRLITARRRVSAMLGATGARGHDGVEWREVVRLVTQARGADRRGADHRGGDQGGADR